MALHIKKQYAENELDFIAWCGVRVSGLTPAHISIDNAIKALEAGKTPCSECLKEVGKFIAGNVQGDD